MKPWHSRIIEALWYLGERSGYEVLDPSVIHLRFTDDPPLAYMPDCVWTYGRSVLNLVIWEVESTPVAKIVAGEVALASMCGTNRALILPHEHSLGKEIRKPLIVPNPYDYRRKRKILPGTRVRLPKAAKVVFMLVLRNEESYEYYKRYVDVITRQRKLFYYSAVTWCDATSLSGAIRSLSHDEEVKWWLE